MPDKGSTHAAQHVHKYYGTTEERLILTAALSLALSRERVYSEKSPVLPSAQFYLREIRAAVRALDAVHIQPRRLGCKQSAGFEANLSLEALLKSETNDDDENNTPMSYYQ